MGWFDFAAEAVPSSIVFLFLGDHTVWLPGFGYPRVLRLAKERCARLLRLLSAASSKRRHIHRHVQVLHISSHPLAYPPRTSCHKGCKVLANLFRLLHAVHGVPKVAAHAQKWNAFVGRHAERLQVLDCAVTQAMQTKEIQVQLRRRRIGACRRSLMRAPHRWKDAEAI